MIISFIRNTQGIQGINEEMRMLCELLGELPEVHGEVTGRIPKWDRKQTFYHFLFNQTHSEFLTLPLEPNI